MTPTQQETPATLGEVMANLRDPTPSLDQQIAVSYLYRTHDGNIDEVHRRLGFTAEDCPRCQSFEFKIRGISGRLTEAFGGDDGLAEAMKGAE